MYYIVVFLDTQEKKAACIIACCEMHSLYQEINVMHDSTDVWARKDSFSFYSVLILDRASNKTVIIWKLA